MLAGVTQVYTPGLLHYKRILTQSGHDPKRFGAVHHTHRQPRRISVMVEASERVWLTIVAS